MNSLSFSQPYDTVDSFCHTFLNFDLVLLAPEHLPQMLQLQDHVYHNLPPEKRNFITPHTPEHFEKFLSGPYNAVGVFHQEKLVAQTLVAFVLPDDEDKNLTWCDSVESILHPGESYGVIGGVLVDKDYRKMGLMTHMVDASISMLTDRNCAMILAEIAKDNIASKKGFEKESFFIAAEGVDPSDGCELVYVQYQPVPGAGL